MGMKKSGNYAFIEGQNLNLGIRELYFDFREFFLTKDPKFATLLLAKTTRPVLAHGGFFNWG